MEKTWNRKWKNFGQYHIPTICLALNKSDMCHSWPEMDIRLFHMKILILFSTLDQANQLGVCGCHSRDLSHSGNDHAATHQNFTKSKCGLNISNIFNLSDSLTNKFIHCTLIKFDSGSFFKEKSWTQKSDKWVNDFCFFHLNQRYAHQMLAFVLDTQRRLRPKRSRRHHSRWQFQEWKGEESLNGRHSIRNS